MSAPSKSKAGAAGAGFTPGFCAGGFVCPSPTGPESMRIEIRNNATESDSRDLKMETSLGLECGRKRG